MKFRFLLLLLLGFGGVALAAPPRLADYDFGADVAVWKSDGAALALQDAHGIAIRGGRDLKLRRYLRLERGERGGSGGRGPLLRAWNGDDLFLESLLRYGERGQILPPRATLISARDGQTRATWENAEFAPDGRTLWFRRGDKFRVLSLTTRRWFDARLPLRAQNRDGDDWDAAISFSPDGRFAADQLADGAMRLWEVRTGRNLTTLSDEVTSAAYPQVMAPVVWSPDGRRVATLGEDPSHRNIFFEEGPNDGTINEHSPVVKVWDARSGKLLQWFASLRAPGQLWWRDNETLAIGSRASFNAEAALEVRRVGAQVGWTVESKSPAALHGDWLLAGRNLFRLGEGKARRVATLFEAPAPLKNVAWSHDGRFVAVSFDGEDARRNDVDGVQIWNARTFALERAGQAHSPMRLAWTASNRIWSSDFYRITSWSEREGWAPNEWRAPVIGKPTFPDENLPPAHGLFLLPDGRRILQLDDSFDRAIYERADEKAAPQLLFKNAQSGGFGEQLSPDGRWLAFWENNEKDSNTLELRAFETRAGGQRFRLPHLAVKTQTGDSRWELIPHFSPDGDYLSWGFRVYKWPSRQVIADMSHLQGDTYALAPGAQSLLRVTSEDVRLVGARGRTLATLSRDVSDVKDAAFSFDGKRVAIARKDKMEVYDVASARLLATLYAWPHRLPQWGAQWLALRPGASDLGTPAARALVTKTRPE